MFTARPFGIQWKDPPIFLPLWSETINDNNNEITEKKWSVFLARHSIHGIHKTMQKSIFAYLFRHCKRSFILFNEGNRWNWWHGLTCEKNFRSRFVMCSYIHFYRYFFVFFFFVVFSLFVSIPIRVWLTDGRIGINYVLVVLFLNEIGICDLHIAQFTIRLDVLISFGEWKKNWFGKWKILSLKVWSVAKIRDATIISRILSLKQEKIIIELPLCSYDINFPNTHTNRQREIANYIEEKRFFPSLIYHMFHNDKNQNHSLGSPGPNVVCRVFITTFFFWAKKEMFFPNKKWKKITFLDIGSSSSYKTGSYRIFSEYFLDQAHLRTFRVSNCIWRVPFFAACFLKSSFRFDCLFSLQTVLVVIHRCIQPICHMASNKHEWFTMFVGCN